MYSGEVDYGYKLIVAPAAAGDSLFQSSDSIKWTYVSDTSRTISTNTTLYFKSDRNGKESAVIKVVLTVKIKGAVVTYLGRTYPTVYIGGARWFARNLDVGTQVVGTSNQSNDTTVEKYCLGDSASSCDSLGGLYQVSEALGMKSTCNSTYCGSWIDIDNNGSAQGLCPSGWRVPTVKDWNKLIASAGGWDSLTASGPNRYGFSLVATGSRNTTGTFDSSYWVYWTSTVFSNSGTILYSSGRTTTFWGNTTGAALRCVQ